MSSDPRGVACLEAHAPPPEEGMNLCKCDEYGDNPKCYRHGEGTDWAKAQEAPRPAAEKPKEAGKCAAREVRERLSSLDCGDNSCWFAKSRGGMRTNGGCRCFNERPGINKATAIVAYVLETLASPCPC